MNKQELITHFQEQKKVIEKEIAFWQAQSDTEAEKPKLRHGDFGYDKDGEVCLALYAQGAKVMRRASDTYLYEWEVSHPTNYKVVDILGNIFDLLKEWSEDLEEFDNELYASGIKIDGKYIKIYACTGGNCTKKDESCLWNLEAIEKFWHKLGQIIATLKRKQT